MLATGPQTIDSQVHLLDGGPKGLCSAVERDGVRPVMDAGNVTSIFVAAGGWSSRRRASSDQRFLIQEFRIFVDAGRARARYRRWVAAIVFGEDTFAESGLRAGLDMITGGLHGFFHQLSIAKICWVVCETRTEMVAGQRGGTFKQ